MCCCVQASGQRSNGSLCISRHVWSGIVLVCTSGDGGAGVSAGSYSETTLHYSTSTPSIANHHSEGVPGLFGHQDSWCLGSCTAAGWLGKSSSPANPRGASASAQLSTHPPPTFFLHSLPHHAPVLHQLRAAGETAGWCCQGERRVRVCLCVCCVRWG